MKQKVLYMLLSLLVAFGIWSYVVTVVSPESEATYYNIPVVLTNESALLEKGMMVTSQTNPTVTLQLRGNRSDLNSLKNSDITVVADLSKINAPGEQLLSCSVSFAGTASPNAFEILNQNPSRILVQIAEWATKDVPVEVRYEGSLGADYIAYKDELELDLAAITITGPKDVVDQIAKAVIDVDLTDQVATIRQNFRYTLCDENGMPVDAATIKTNAAEVHLALKIQRVKELLLAVDVIYGGGATKENTSITLNYQTIKVAGSEKLLDSLEDKLILGSLDLSKIPEDTVLTMPVKLPEGLENLSGVKEVEVSISFPDLATKTLTVSKIFVSHIPAGMTYDPAEAVEVMVRGPKERIESISAEHLSVLIDLAGAELGTNLYKAKILLDTAYEKEVGAIGTYNVLVTLTETLEDAG